ncbi:MAG: biotin--[acetyl-CoA-carboxylase] ligase [Chthoniobacteraceae bacterium]
MLNPDRLEQLLAGCPLAREIKVFAETGSTNDVAAQYGKAGAPGGVVIFAERQTRGRGRQGRRWESEPGAALAFSILLRPEATSMEWSRLTLCAAVALAESVEELTGESTQIKWPNDLYLLGKKAAGILVETGTSPSSYAVLGIGINVNQEKFADELAETAISLRQATHRVLEREVLAAQIVLKIAALSANLTENFSEIITAARKRDFLFGRAVQLVKNTDSTLSAMAEGFDEAGALRLRFPDGSLQMLSSGEVSVRPVV